MILGQHKTILLRASCEFLIVVGAKPDISTTIRDIRKSLVVFAILVIFEREAGSTEVLACQELLKNGNRWGSYLLFFHKGHWGYYTWSQADIWWPKESSLLISVICYSPNRNKDMLERKLWWFGSLPIRLGSVINSLWFLRLTLES